MLSFFPELLFLSPFAALIIRVALACVFAYSAAKRFPDTRTSLKAFGVIDALLAVLLFVGAYTQLAAIAGAVCLIAWLFVPSIRPLPRSTVALALVMALTLIITGAGPLAFDLPL